MPMKSLSNLQYIFVALALVCLGYGAPVFAAQEDFCNNLETIQETIEQKKSQRIDALRDLQAQHENRFGESKKNFTVLTTAYQKRTVTPTYPESSKREALEKIDAFQERLDRAQAFFNQERTGMNAVLARVTDLEKEAFQEAYDACAEGVTPAEVAETFKADMAEIQSYIYSHTETMKERKEQLGTLREKNDTPSTRRPFLFFNSQRIRN